MASKGAGGGAGGGVGRTHLGLEADYNSLKMEYVVAKTESEKKFGTIRLAQIMRDFGNTVLSEIAKKDNPFMFAVALLKNSTMKHEWNQLNDLKSTIEGIQRQLEPVLHHGKEAVSNEELLDALIKTMIDILNKNYSKFFPEKAIFPADFYGPILAKQVEKDKAFYFSSNFPSVPTHTSKGGRRKSRRRRQRKSRKN